MNRPTPRRARVAAAIGALGIATTWSASAGASSAAAAPNNCGPASIAKNYPWDTTGYLVHSCTAETQVTYLINCFPLPSVNYAVYFAADASIYKRISCGPAAIIGIEKWEIT
jgi:hypothetical protein